MYRVGQLVGRRFLGHLPKGDLVSAEGDSCLSRVLQEPLPDLCLLPLPAKLSVNRYLAKLSQVIA